MTPQDLRLIEYIQQRVPLTRRPFDQIGRELQLPPADVMARIDQWRASRVLREISAIFDVTRLGYRQALLALRVPAEQLDAAGAMAAKHPGVSHCYGRQGDYNLWLTLAVSPDSRLGLENTAQRLAQLAHATASLLLPTIKQYKLQVQFSPFSQAAAAGPADTPPASAAGPDSPSAPEALNDAQRQAIAALQIDLPCHRDAFEPLAEAAQTSVANLLAQAEDFLQRGLMRRYAAVLHHQNAGAAANVLVAWQADASAADIAGQAATELSSISHCYLRPNGADWPYNLYTMIHGQSPAECEATIQTLAETANLSRHVALWTLREFKKQRVPLFWSDEEMWEETYGAGADDGPDDDRSLMARK